MLSRISSASLRISPDAAGSGAARFAHTVSVVLKKDIPPRGFAGSVIDVKAGYMRNYLYPGRLAVYATPDNVAKYAISDDGTIAAAAQEEAAEEVQKLDPDLLKFQSYMRNRTVVVKRAFTDKNVLVKPDSVTASVFTDKLRSQHKVELEEGEDIVMPSVQEEGEYNVILTLAGGKTEIKMKVVKR